jgi:hypothetical protein
MIITIGVTTENVRLITIAATIKMRKIAQETCGLLTS